MTEDEFTRLVTTLSQKKNNNNFSRIVGGLVVTIVAALLIGTWSIVYTRVEKVATIQQGRGERITALETMMGVTGERLIRIEKKLDDLLEKRR